MNNKSNNKKRNTKSKAQKRPRRAQPKQRAVAGSTAYVRSAQAPVACASVVQVSKQGNQSKFRLSERIGSVQVEPTTPVGIPLLQLLINPLTWLGTRVAAEAQLWQQYRFTRLSIRCIPGVPTIASGQYLHGHDTEAQNMNLDGDALLAYMSNLPGATMAPVWKETACNCSVEAYIRSQAWFKLEGQNPSLPDYCQGLYLWTLTQPFSGVSSGAAGFTIWAEGEIEFAGRRITGAYNPDPAGAIDIASGTDFRVALDGIIEFTSGSNYFDQMKAGYAYVIEPLSCIQAINDVAGSVQAAAVRRGPGNGNAYFYKTLVGCLNADPAELIKSDPLLLSTLYETESGKFIPVKLPDGTPTLASFRTRSQPGKLVAKGKSAVKVEPAQEGGIAAIVAAVVAALGSIDILGARSGANNSAPVSVSGTEAANPGHG